MLSYNWPAVLSGYQMNKVQIDWWHDRRYLGAYRKRKSTPEVCQVIASLFGILAKSYGRILLVKVLKYLIMIHKIQSMIEFVSLKFHFYPIFLHGKSILNLTKKCWDMSLHCLIFKSLIRLI